MPLELDARREFWLKGLLVALLLLLMGLNAGVHLSGQVMSEFDESRHVASAVEMRKSGDFLVTTYMGKPDFWNAKPPLSIWAVAAAYPLTENKLISTRLPAIAAAFATCLVIFLYACRISGFYAGLLAVALFMTSRRYIIYHGVRTADADALFILMICLATFFASEATRRGTALAYFFLGLAFMTKSFHVLPYGLVVFVFTVYLWRLGKLSLAEILLLPALFLLPILPWAWLRWQADGAQFFEEMIFYDLLKRSTEVIEGRSEAIYYYFVIVVETVWPALLAAGFLAFRHVRGRIFQDHRQVLLLLWFFVPLLAYTAAQSKFPWYVFPLFPAISITSGIWLFDKGGRLGGDKLKWVLAFLVLSILPQEQGIFDRIRHYPVSPVIAAMQDLSRRYPQERIEVSLEEPWRQHYYATALILGNIQPVLPERDRWYSAGTRHVRITPKGIVEPIPRVADQVPHL